MRNAHPLMIAQGCAIVLAAAAGAPFALGVDPAPEPTRLADIPVVRATVFKDGTAMLVHRGVVACDDTGHATITGLPAPILGTFWATSADPTRPIRSTRAEFATIASKRAAATIADLLAANKGGDAVIKLIDGREIKGEIMELPVPPPNPETANSRTNYAYYNNRMLAGEPAPPLEAPATMVLVRDGTELRALPIASIVELAFGAEAETEFAAPQYEPALIVECAPSAAGSETPIELMYMQRGLRWIPNYRATIADNGRAVIELQASVINDAVDLVDAPVEFIVGVPSFAFSDAVDPISLRNTPPILSGFFSPITTSVVTSMIMSQVGARQDAAGGGQGPNPVPLESTGEDQFIYAHPGLTVAKGQRAVVPLKTFTLEITDGYRVHVPISPPAAYRSMHGSSRFDEIVRALSTPPVQHVVSFTNTSDAPLTTAPVLIVAAGRPLAQSVTQYTPVGADGEFTLSTAIDITTGVSAAETNRTPDATAIDGRMYTKIDLAGTITLTNRKPKTVSVLVSRDLFGNLASASHDPQARKLAGFHEVGARTPTAHRWWDWYGWPVWSSSINPITRLEWTVTLKPSESITLNHTWSYYWD